MHMKRTVITLFGTTALVIIALIMAAGAVAVPTGGSSAQEVVDNLHASGYKVIVSKVGGGSLDNCDVTAVRPGRPVTQVVSIGGGDTIEKVLYTTVYVDVKC
jgi:hypothetical protein